ncbi:MAG TPA: DNA mismatch repair protein MutS [Gemmatimonadaceae bacterium]|nr:DNA mismatch repair protein MutS [Gemmatimonadaceae bacterium]
MSGDSTPLMQQYREIKAQHQGAVLMFRMGDFYEMFYEDAEIAARVLGLTLTTRNNGAAASVPLAGVPVKAVTEYLRRLVQQGYRVAICEQVEDPRLARGIVRRAVVETVTPGVTFSEDILQEQRPNYVCAIASVGDRVGVAAVDVSTGDFRLVTVAMGSSELPALLGRFSPRELVVARGAATLPAHSLDGILVTEREGWEFEPAVAGEVLREQFSLHTLEGLGLGANEGSAIAAGGALVRYLRELQPGGIPHLRPPRLEQLGATIVLDEMTRRNLELVESLRSGVGRDASGTLLAVLDRTETPMGARLLREWLLAPLRELSAIRARLDAVGALFDAPLARAALRRELAGIRDIERLAGRAAAGRATPRDLRALGESLHKLPQLRELLCQVDAAGLLASIAGGWDDCSDVTAVLLGTLVERPAMAVGEGDVIASGVDAELDQLRQLRDGGKQAIAAIQAAERERTGIGSLKVGYNKVFGYYIEVSNANKHLVPPDYQRRQTLTGAERYVTPALKEYEERVLTASERIEARERELFEQLRRRVAGEVRRLQDAAARVAALDVLAALAEVAATEGYVRPEVNDGYDLELVGGRHPVLEKMMPRERFIPNDVSLNADARIIVLTGPNMAGKSTLLRQVGLIVLLAQMGSFVPAARARIGIVDRVFTRVGASDNLVRGQSTFMVEMAETSAILHQATARSLVLLDEIGRGTSTYDGVSIAWAVSEDLHDRIGCKAIFATHYHELTQLANELSGVRNYNVAVREIGDDVVFLYRLQPGGADRSYGIEVGRLAGLPATVIARARELLRRLEGEAWALGLVPASALQRSAEPQLSLFPAEEHPVLERLRAVDPDRMTPLEALRLLDELVREVRNG